MIRESTRQVLTVLTDFTTMITVEHYVVTDGKDNTEAKMVAGIYECPLCREPHSGRATMDIPEFGALFKLSRAKAYELAARDELPVRVIRLGRRRVLSRAEVHRLIHESKGEGYERERANT